MMQLSLLSTDLMPKSDLSGAPDIIDENQMVAVEGGFASALNDALQTVVLPMQPAPRPHEQAAVIAAPEPKAGSERQGTDASGKFLPMEQSDAAQSGSLLPADGAFQLQTRNAEGLEMGGLEMGGLEMGGLNRSVEAEKGGQLSRSSQFSQSTQPSQPPQPPLSVAAAPSREKAVPPLEGKIAPDEAGNGTGPVIFRPADPTQPIDLKVDPVREVSEAPQPDNAQSDIDRLDPLNVRRIENDVSQNRMARRPDLAPNLAANPTQEQTASPAPIAPSAPAQLAPAAPDILTVRSIPSARNDIMAADNIGTDQPGLSPRPDAQGLAAAEMQKPQPLDRPIAREPEKSADIQPAPLPETLRPIPASPDPAPKKEIATLRVPSEIREMPAGDTASSPELGESEPTETAMPRLRTNAIVSEMPALQTSGAELSSAFTQRSAPAPIAQPAVNTSEHSAPLRDTAPLERLVETITQMRESGQTGRGEISLRHSDFGKVSMQVSANDGELQARLASRDPAFAAAAQDALAEKQPVDRSLAPAMESSPNSQRNGENGSSANGAMRDFGGFAEGGQHRGQNENSQKLSTKGDHGEAGLAADDHAPANKDATGGGASALYA